MKYFDSNKQTVKEFNEILKDGLEHGFILSTKEDLKLIIELTYNLNYYLNYFISATQLYGEEKD